METESADKPIESHQPRGVFESIASLNAYVSKPSTEPLGVLLLLPDGFGLAKHNFILADHFAEAGWYVVIPDYYERDPIPLEVLERNPSLSIDEHDWSEEKKERLKNLDVAQWTLRHSADHIDNLLHRFVPSVREANPGKNIFATGYCYGGKFAIRLSSWAVKAALAFHPVRSKTVIRRPIHVSKSLT